MEDIAKIGFQADTRQLTLAEKTLNALTGASGRAEKASVKLSRVLGSLAGAAAAFFSGREVARMVQEYTALNNTLRILEPNQTAVNKRIRELADIANRTRSPLQATATLYQRIGVASKELGASSQDTLKFIEAVGYAMGQSSGSAAAAEGALLQLAQALGGGNIQAEEFNSLMDGAYPLVMAAARGIDEAGGSVGKLRNLVKEGEISSREFFEAILSQGDALAETFGDSLLTIGQAFTVLRNNLILFIGQLDQSAGISAAFAAVIMGLASGVQYLAQNMDTVIAVMGGLAAAIFTAALPSMLALATSAIAQAAIWGGTLMVGIRAAIAGFYLMAATSGVLTASLMAVRAALIATGFGAVVVLVGALVFKFIELTQKVGSVKNALTSIWYAGREVFQRLGSGVQAVQNAFLVVWTNIQVAFMNMLLAIMKAFNGFIGSIAGALQGIPGMEGMQNGLATKYMQDGAEISAYEVKIANMAKTAKTASDDMKKSFSDMQKPLSDWSANLFGGKHPGKEKDDIFVAPTETQITAMNDYGNAAGGAAEKLSELQRIAEGFDKLTEPFQQAKAAFDAVQGAFDIGAIGADKYANALSQIEQAFIRTGGSAEQWGMVVSGASKTLEAQIIDLKKKGFESLGSSIADLVVDGKANFGDLAKSIVKDMINITIQAAILKPLMDMLGLSSGGVAGVPANINAVPNALGNAYAGGNVVPFAKGGAFTNQVVTQPTLFAFAKGGALGLMGEAGPEAIMPLSRARDGSLGVQMVGAAGARGDGNTMVVQVINNADGTAVRTERQQNSDGTEIQRIIIDTVNEGKAQGKFDAVDRARNNMTVTRIVR